MLENAKIELLHERVQALEEQLEAVEEFKAAMVRANQRQVEMISDLRGPMEQIARLHRADAGEAPEIARRTLDRIDSYQASEPKGDWRNLIDTHG